MSNHPDDADAVTPEQIVDMIHAELRSVFPDPAKIMTAEIGLSMYMHFAEQIDSLEKRLAKVESSHESSQPNLRPHKGA